MFDVDQRIHAVKNALAQGDSAALRTATLELYSALLLAETITEEMYSPMEELLTKDHLYRSDSPEQVLSLFADNLDRLSETQRVRLARTLNEAYGLCNSEAGCMQMMEMQTKLVTPNAFIEFARRAAHGSLTQRAIAGYGLGYFWRETKPSEPAATSALDLLKVLARDPERDVRNEAEHVLARIAKSAH